MDEKAIHDEIDALLEDYTHLHNVAEYYNLHAEIYYERASKVLDKANALKKTLNNKALTKLNQIGEDNE